jgi:L-iditol 2-dehydrogenase
MKALLKVHEGFGNLELRDIPEPTVQRNEVIVKIRATGICGSDLHHYRFGTSSNPASIHNIKIPVVLGHEFAGDIVEVGSDVSTWKIGDRIVSETHARYCGTCRQCRTGNYHLCVDRKGFGSSVDGSFTELLAVPARLLHLLPDNLSYPEATILQPAADIVHAIWTNSSLSTGDTVVVVGPGPMGLLAVQLSKLAGAGQVLVAGLTADAGRLKMATALGADLVVNLDEQDLSAVVREHSCGRGADAVFETSGSQAGFLAGIALLAKKGTLTVIGVHDQPVQVRLDLLQQNEQRIHTSILSTWRDYDLAITLARQGQLRLKEMVTGVFKLTEWQEAFEYALSKQGCKVVFELVSNGSES